MSYVNGKVLQKYKKARSLPYSIKIFDNGNTFIRFEGEVAYSKVLVVMPEYLTANDLMEALIKVRTAKDLGAASIEIVTDTTSETPRFLVQNLPSVPVEHFLKVAGASKINGNVIKAAPVGRKSLRNSKSTVVTGDLHPELGVELAASLGIEYKSYSDASRGSKSQRVILVSPPINPSNWAFLEGLSQASQLTRSGRQVVYVTPYLPYARSDKVDQDGISVTGKLAADLIEAAGPSAVAFVRPHAPQSQGFFNIPTINISGKETISAYLKSQGVDVVVSPDAGFQKDATVYADTLGVSVAVINKQRDPRTGKTKIVDMVGPKMKNLTAAIVDDETASGGTMEQSAEIVHKQGAKKILAVVTHLAGDAAKAVESGLINIVVSTNTLPTSRSETTKFVRLSIAQELATGLRRFVRLKSCSSTVNENPGDQK